MYLYIDYANTNSTSQITEIDFYTKSIAFVDFVFDFVTALMKSLLIKVPPPH